MASLPNPRKFDLSERSGVANLLMDFKDKLSQDEINLLEKAKNGDELSGTEQNMIESIRSRLLRN